MSDSVQTHSSPAGSPLPGILQARILEWVAISFSNACMHDPMDSSPLGSSVHRILQPRIFSGLPFPSPDIFLKTFYLGRIKIYLMGIADCPLFAKFGLHSSSVWILLFYVKCHHLTLVRCHHPHLDYSCVGIGRIGPKVALWTRTLKLPLFAIYSWAAPESDPQREVPTSFYLRKFDQTSHFCSSHFCLSRGDTCKAVFGDSDISVPIHSWTFIRSMFLVKLQSLCTTTGLILTHFILLSYPPFEKESYEGSDVLKVGAMTKIQGILRVLRLKTLGSCAAGEILCRYTGL